MPISKFFSPQQYWNIFYHIKCWKTFLLSWKIAIMKTISKWNKITSCIKSHRSSLGLMKLRFHLINSFCVIKIIDKQFSLNKKFSLCFVRNGCSKQLHWIFQQVFFFFFPASCSPCYSVKFVNWKPIWQTNSFFNLSAIVSVKPFLMLSSKLSGKT